MKKDAPRTLPVTCGACGKVERSQASFELSDGRLVYPLPDGWRRYVGDPDKARDPDEDDHLQCAACEALPF